MFVKLFLISAILHFGSANVLNRFICSYLGPDYWCSNNSAAENCGKKTYCEKYVWTQLPEKLSNDSCDSCKNFVLTVSVFLSDEKSIAEIILVVKQVVCVGVPELFHGVCNRLFEIYGESFLFKVGNILEKPDLFCAYLDLCSVTNTIYQNSMMKKHCEYHEIMLSALSNINPQTLAPMTNKVCTAMMPLEKCEELIPFFMKIVIHYIKINSERMCKAQPDITYGQKLSQNQKTNDRAPAYFSSQEMVQNQGKNKCKMDASSVTNLVDEDKPDKIQCEICAVFITFIATQSSSDHPSIAEIRELVSKNCKNIPSQYYKWCQRIFLENVEIIEQQLQSQGRRIKQDQICKKILPTCSYPEAQVIEWFASFI